ncbi:MAG TPA: type II secretion system protein [Tepidisphaeraceae bacterium]|nr:type II secretion system protein [Tepidisphaeraceae bacterium]
MRHRRALSLIEILVVIGIVALLIGILVPVLIRAREHSKQSQCATNLHAIHQAFSAYAAENNGFIPRAGSYTDYSDDGPAWIIGLVRYLGFPKGGTWDDVPKMKVLGCPSHPTEKIPSAFVVNAYSFPVSATAFDGTGAIAQSKIVTPANWPLLLEANDQFNSQSQMSTTDDIFFEVQHHVRRVDHINPNAEKCRITWNRHDRGGSNVLFGDGHVAPSGQPLVLEAFDYSIAH